MTHATHASTHAMSRVASLDRARSSSGVAWRSRAGLVSVAAALLLTVATAGCGGSGSSGVDSAPSGAAPAAPAAQAPVLAPPPAPKASTSTLTGQVVVVPTPVTVTLQIVDADRPGQVVVLTTTVDNSGNYSILAPVSVIPTHSQIAAVISAEGYVPTTVIYATDANGAVTPLEAITVSGSQPASAPIVLVPATPSVFAFPGLDILGRMGDGNFSGTVNSKLQLPAPPRDQPVTILSSQRVAYQDGSKVLLQVRVLTRGLQATRCPGAKLVLLGFNPPSIDFQSQEQALESSPENGDFSIQTVSFALSPSWVGGDLQLEVHTGYCGLNDYDDIEVVGATGTMN